MAQAGVGGCASTLASLLNPALLAVVTLFLIVDPQVFVTCTCNRVIDEGVVLKVGVRVEVDEATLE